MFVRYLIYFIGEETDMLNDLQNAVNRLKSIITDINYRTAQIQEQCNEQSSICAEISKDLDHSMKLLNFMKSQLSGDIDSDNVLVKTIGEYGIYKNLIVGTYNVVNLTSKKLCDTTNHLSVEAAENYIKIALMQNK